MIMFVAFAASLVTISNIVLIKTQQPYEGKANTPGYLSLWLYVSLLTYYYYYFDFLAQNSPWYPNVYAGGKR